MFCDVRINARLLIRISKTVAIGHFNCVHQKRIDTDRGKTGLSLLLKRFSVMYVTGYTRE